MIKFAEIKDIEEIKKIAGKSKKELSFICRGRIEKSITAGECLVFYSGKIVGFVLFHLRRDGILTIYDLCVLAEERKKGIGRKFIEFLRPMGKFIKLKCPEKLPANKFYSATGFKLEKTEKGLNWWKL